MVIHIRVPAPVPIFYTRRKTPISLSALDKNPMLGHLFEGNPVDEGTKRRTRRGRVQGDGGEISPALCACEPELVVFLGYEEC